LVLVALMSVGTSADEPKRILVLHSFGRHFMPWNEVAKHFREELYRRFPSPFNILDETVPNLGDDAAAGKPPLLGYLRILYAGHEPDLIVGIGAPAASFLQEHRGALFPGSPLLLAAVELRRLKALGPNDTVVANSIDIPALVENILRLLPDTTNIAVVIGNSPLEQWWVAQLRTELQRFTDRITFVWYNELPFEAMLQRAATLPPNSAILFAVLLTDAAGVWHEEDIALKRLRAVAKAPIFSFVDAHFDGPIVGGPLAEVETLGRTTGDVAARILAGEAAGSIRTPPIGFGKPKYDWRELTHWGISESRLPADSAIYFRDTPLWERVRLPAAAAAALVLAQASIIYWLLIEQGRRRRSEAGARELTGRLIHAQEEERSRLGRELHDDVTQRLALLSIDVARAERSLAPPPGNGALGKIQQELASLSDDVHALSYQLHPAVLTDLGLREALGVECERFSQTSSVNVDLRIDEGTDSAPGALGLCLLRVAQESLRNIGRHARATRAEVRLKRSGKGLQLDVQDDGIGFDARERRTRVSLGHSSMRERVSQLAGTLRIESRPGRGALVSVWLPLGEDA
jgi:signal transduction histidine kinase